MGLFKKKVDNYNKYARLFPAKIQNRILLEAVSKISGPKLIDYLKQLNKDEARDFYNKYPDIKARLNNPLKNKIYPSMLKKAALLTPVFWFGLLPKHEQAKYFQRIKDNLPWNKRKKTQEIKTKTELKSSGIKEVRFGVGNQKVVAGVPFRAFSKDNQSKLEQLGFEIRKISGTDFVDFTRWNDETGAIDSIEIDDNKYILVCASGKRALLKGKYKELEFKTEDDLIKYLDNEQKATSSYSHRVTSCTNWVRVLKNDLTKMGFVERGFVKNELEYGQSMLFSVKINTKEQTISCSIRTGENSYLYISPLDIEKTIDWIEKNQKLLDALDMWGERSDIEKIKNALNKFKVQKATSSYTYKGVTTTASCKEEAIAIFACVEAMSEGMRKVIASDDSERYNVYVNYYDTASDGGNNEVGGDPENSDGRISWTKTQALVNKIKNDFLAGKLKGSFLYEPITKEGGKKGEFHLENPENDKVICYNKKKGYFSDYKGFSKVVYLKTRKKAEELLNELNNSNSNLGKGKFEVVENKPKEYVNKIKIICEPKYDEENYVVTVYGDGKVEKDTISK